MFSWCHTGKVYVKGVFYVSALHLQCVSSDTFRYFVFSTAPRQPIATTDLSSGSNTAAEAEQSSAMTSQSVAPPGLSTAAVKRVTADSPLEPNTLEQVIICIRHYICTLEFVHKLRISLNSKKCFKFYSAACNIAPFWGAPLLERERGAFLYFSSVQNIWMPFWVDKTMPQMTPELIPNFSLNPGKLNGESSRLSELFGAIFQTPFSFFKSVCLKEMIWLYFIIVFSLR